MDIPFNSIKYFVYRGLLKSSFVSGTAITPQTETSSEFIERFWTDWNNYKTNTDQSALADPTPQSLGYDNSLANSLTNSLTIKSIYDNLQTGIRASNVKKGEWIGDFGNAFKIGFEIITEENNLLLDLIFLRAEIYKIDVSGSLVVRLKNAPQENRFYRLLILQPFSGFITKQAWTGFGCYMQRKKSACAGRIF